MSQTRVVLPLRSLHASLGARWTVDGGVEVPAHFGDPEAERRLLGTGCGLWDGSAADRLELLGPDRQRFLSGMTTADIAGLGPTASCYGLFTTVHGRIITDATVLAHADRLWIRLPPSMGAPVREHLSRFVITDQVEIMPLTDMVPLFLVGPTSLDVVGRWSAQEVALEPGEHRRLELLGTEVCVLREERFAVDACSLWISAGVVREWVAALLEDSDPPSPVGLEALERLRIEHGIPRFGSEIGPETFPQEAGVGDAVSYDKGCYLGQEVVARIHYRGGVQRLLVRLEIDGAATPPAAGSAVSFDGREAGYVTSVAPRFAASGWVAMALLAKRASEPGTVVKLAGAAEARVTGAAGLGAAEPRANPE